ncbi:uncharacterized protein LOC128870372 [Anastrepha ludens]|uniref:uncharacterized protein LOC128870372 n=1 Tax=Anastrepha ludens TaxID=28586 RepID=UPI0023B19FFF|nr:uncharacterized protein LOC128870372 [Anastrepha ludens]
MTYKVSSNKRVRYVGDHEAPVTRDGYNVHRHDRQRDNGGGLAFIVHHTVQYRLIDEGIDRRDSTLECQGIAVRSGDSELEIFNVYIPPVTCCPAGYHPDIGALIRGENRLVVGDFNAHHDLWHSSLPNDRRGQQLAEQIDDSTFSTVNDDAPTRVVGNGSSSPDLTIASAGLINSITWRPMLSLASDHLPIIVSIERPADFVSANHRSYFNFKKANWTGFTEFTEDTFAALPIPTDVRVGERAFRKVLTAAAARFIPAGSYKDIRPHFPAEAASLANERDHLRQADPGDPRIRDLNLEIRQLVNQHKRTKWVEHLKTCNLTSGVSKLWSTVRSLSNPTKHNDKVAITFNGCTSSDPKRCASYFSRLFRRVAPKDTPKPSPAGSSSEEDHDMCLVELGGNGALGNARNDATVNQDHYIVQLNCVNEAIQLKRPDRHGLFE